MIPVSIAMIPVALVSLLLCVCFCGPKETRGQAPEKILGLRLSQRKKMEENSFDTVSMKSVEKTIKKTATDDEELEYKDGYVQRRDSKKTRFSTSVSFIDPPMRRASSVSCLEGLQSRSGSFAVPVPQTTANEINEEMENRKLSRHISFNDSVSILGEDPSETISPLPESVKRKSIFKRSESVN
uniref:Uncharacterized protein n=1 Tax=Panagrolaimus sp. ES5 TaxID=591445 RepID=A0AC34GT50_9BILA